MATLIRELREQAADLRKLADASTDARHAKLLREVADDTEGAATAAANSVDYKNWLRAGCPEDDNGQRG